MTTKTCGAPGCGNALAAGQRVYCSSACALTARRMKNTGYKASGRAAVKAAAASPPPRLELDGAQAAELLASAARLIEAEQAHYTAFQEAHAAPPQDQHDAGIRESDAMYALLSEFDRHVQVLSRLVGPISDDPAVQNRQHGPAHDSAV